MISEKAESKERIEVLTLSSPFLFSLSRSRNLALRALSETSRRTHQIWNDSILQNLNFYPTDMAPIGSLFEAHPEKGLRVKTFHHYRPLNTKQGAYANVLPELVGGNYHVSEEDKLSWTLVLVPFGMERIFKAIKNVETIVVEDPFYMFPFVQKVDEKHVILPALVNNLKRLRIHSSHRKQFQLRARKAIWLLLFCPHLVVSTILRNRQQIEYC